MSKIFKFITSQWSDIKGNAKWDFIKLGAIAMIAGLAAFVRFLGHAPLWQVLTVYVATFALVGLVVLLFQKRNPAKYKKETVEEIARRNFPERFEPAIDLKPAEKSEADKLVIKKQFAKKMLGAELEALQARLNNAMNISRWQFKDDLKDKELQTTRTLFVSTESLLKTLLTEAEAARFSIATGKPVKEVTDDPYNAESRMDWQWHINCIIAKRDKLEEIMKELG